MRDLRSRVAYLQGLAEGLDLDASSAEGRVLSALIDTMEEMAGALDNLYETQEELADYVDEIDEDLGAVEDWIYDETVEGTEGEDGVELLLCPECGETLSASAGAMEEAEFDVTCPVCGCSLQEADGAHAAR